MFKGAQRLQDGTNNEAKVQATLLAIELACNLKISNLHLEDDSKIVTDAISGGSSKYWRITKFVSAICSKLSPSQDFKILHIRRESNGEADTLSNVACHLNPQMIWWWYNLGVEVAWDAYLVFVMIFFY